MKEWPTLVRTGVPPMLGDHLGHDVRADQVVEDGLARVLGEHRGGDERRRQRARDRLGPLVDEEDPVGVAIEGQADVGALLEHRRLEVHQVLGLDRVGRVVGEGAVELGEEDVDVEGEASEHHGHHQAAHAVGRVGHDLERAQRPDVDEGDDVVGPLLEQVELAPTSPVTAAVGSPSSASAHRLGSRPGRCRARSGRAPARQNLMPLYCAGLCEAVNMAPGASR